MPSSLTLPDPQRRNVVRTVRHAPYRTPRPDRGLGTPANNGPAGGGALAADRDPQRSLSSSNRNSGARSGWRHLNRAGADVEYGASLDRVGRRCYAIGQLGGRLRPPCIRRVRDREGRALCHHSDRARSAGRDRKQSSGQRALDPATTPRLAICQASCSRRRSMPDTDLLAVAQAPEVLTRADRSHGRQAVPLASDRRVEHVEAHRRPADEELPAA